MQPKLVLLAVYIALATSSIAPSLAAPTTDRSQIQAAYDRQNQAAATKNLKLFMQTYSPNYKAIDDHGQTTSRHDAQTATSALFLNADHIAAQTTITAITIKAGKAYVTAKNHVVAIAHDPATQAAVTLIDDQVDNDVWTKVNGVWLEEYERVVTDHSFTQQGTPLDSKPGQST
jgi:hypothetical protein